MRTASVQSVICEPGASHSEALPAVRAANVPGIDVGEALHLHTLPEKANAKRQGVVSGHLLPIPRDPNAEF